MITNYLMSQLIRSPENNHLALMATTQPHKQTQQWSILSIEQLKEKNKR